MGWGWGWGGGLRNMTSILYPNLRLSRWIGDSLESTNPAPPELRSTRSKQPMVGSWSPMSKPERCGSSSGFGFQNPTKNELTWWYFAYILSPSRSKSDPARSSPNPSRSWRIQLDISQVSMDPAKSRPRKRNPKPKTTRTGCSDENSKSGTNPTQLDLWTALPKPLPLP